MDIPTTVSPGHPAFWRNFYETRGPGGECEWFVSGQSAADLFVSHVPLDPTSTRLLEVGCGTSNLGLLMRPFVKSVLAIDICPNAVEICRGRTSDKGIEYAVADVCRVSDVIPRDSFDVVIDKGTLDALLSSDKCHTNGERFIETMGEVVCAGGRLAILTLNDVSVIMPFIHSCETANWEIVVEQAVCLGTRVGKSQPYQHRGVEIITTGSRYTLLVFVKGS